MDGWPSRAGHRQRWDGLAWPSSLLREGLNQPDLRYQTFFHLREQLPLAVIDTRQGVGAVWLVLSPLTRAHAFSPHLLRAWAAEATVVALFVPAGSGDWKGFNFAVPCVRECVSVGDPGNPSNQS